MEGVIYALKQAEHPHLLSWMVSTSEEHTSMSSWETEAESECELGADAVEVEDLVDLRVFSGGELGSRTLLSWVGEDGGW